MNKYFLTGIPNSGKSTLGKLVAEKLGLPFYDTDDMAVKAIGGVRLFDIFSSRHTSRLYAEQINAIIELSKMEGAAIVATGAEVALIPKCVDYMVEMGIIIYIKRDIELVREDLKKTAGQRIALKEENTGTIFDMHEIAADLYVKELSQYEEAADVTLENNGNIDEGVERLTALISAGIQAEKENAVKVSVTP